MPNLTYRLKYQAENSIGLQSQFSTVQEMPAGTYPSAPGSPQLVSESNEMIYFTWSLSFDNGGSMIKEHEVHITRVSDSDETLISVVNASEFKYTAANGLTAGHEYLIKVRSLNFFTSYYNLVGPWSGASTFYSSNLPEPVTTLSYDIGTRTKTDAKISWDLHTDPAKKGYSTIDPYYLLWIDDCHGGLFSALLVNSTTADSFSITSMIPGSLCRFRLNTLNIIDYSETYSEVLEILFAVEPDAPAAPEYVDRHGGDLDAGLSPYITIKWKQPLEDGGSPNLGFRVELS